MLSNMKIWHARIAMALTAAMFALVGQAAMANSANVFYYTGTNGWTAVDIHYSINGTWTTAPGVGMTLACTSWYTKSINLGTATSLVAAFNNGSGTWDNNNSNNYTINAGTTTTTTVKNGVIASNVASPCVIDTQAPTVPAGLTSSANTTSTISLTWTASTDNVGVTGYNVYRNGVKVGTSTTTSYTDSGLAASTAYSYTLAAYDAAGNTSAQSTVLSVTTQSGNTAVVYYYTGTNGWTAADIHYSINGTWTTAPGVGMTLACTSWYTKAINLGSATSLVAAFNNGSGTWDNNNSNNYTINAGTTTVKNGVVASNAASPCVIDTQAPTVPTALGATVSGCSVALHWTASTDNVGVTGYQILRNGSVLTTATATSYTDNSSLANTGYSYTVKAYDGAGNFSAASTAAAATTGSCTTPPPFRLGVMYTPAQSTFSIWSPDTANVVLNLNGSNYTMTKIADANGYTNVYQVVVTGDQNLKPYNFKINGNTSRDPYGVMVQAGTDNNIVLDMSQTALPGGWAPTPPLVNRVDSVIYETHVRDFTIDASSGVPAAQRGTYAGMTLAGTTVNGTAGAPKTGIDHLVDMGVTHIQIMPIFDFSSCSPNQVASNPNCYNWGYDPINFNVPEERYSQTPNDYIARVKEFKAMIDGFHKRGIRVVMDVVYNHTSSTSALGGITSKYYNATDLSGTGNSLDGAQPMVARMIQDSLEYWTKEYNFDGFRFDLLGAFPTTVVGGWGTYLNATYPTRNLLLYGEPWTGGADNNERQHVRYGTVGTIASSHFGVFNGAYRDAIKNSNGNGGGSTGFMFNQGTSDSSFGAYNANSRWPVTALGMGAISVGVKASPLANLPATLLPNVWDPMFTATPEQTINYVDVHDNLNLADKVTAWAAANGQSSNTAYLTRLQQYAMSMVLTSQGIPLLNGGSEFQRTKNGDSNSYQSPDSVNKVNWNLRTSNAPTYDFIKKLIALRKSHPGFRFTTWAAVDTNVLADQRSASLVYTLINSAANGDAWSKELVIFNSGGDQVVTLPSGNWNVAVEQSSATAGNDRVVSGSVTATGAAITVLHQ